MSMALLMAPWYSLGQDDEKKVTQAKKLMKTEVKSLKIAWLQ